MSEVIAHEGIITKINDDTVEVKILSRSACAACHAKSACSLSDMQEKTLTVPRPEGQELHLMEKVNLQMTVGQGNRAAVLAYLLPIVIVMAVLFTLLALGVSEGLSGLISLLTLLPYSLVVFLCRKKISKKFDYQILPVEK